ncbi:hypothetical protein [Teichococcus aestuarii]|uniref:hypothetical protein n=1 Tax=Teichococcus aestuarii TaxID=568898 RepID=UPI003606D88E
MERLIQAGFDEVFNHLDPYSRYITAEEAWEARQRRVGQSGLGLRVASGPRGSVVVAALEAEGRRAAPGCARATRCWRSTAFPSPPGASPRPRSCWRGRPTRRCGSACGGATSA